MAAGAGARPVSEGSVTADRSRVAAGLGGGTLKRSGPFHNVLGTAARSADPVEAGLDVLLLLCPLLGLVVLGLSEGVLEGFAPLRGLFDYLCLGCGPNHFAAWLFSARIGSGVGVVLL